MHECAGYLLISCLYAYATCNIGAIDVLNTIFEKVYFKATQTSSTAFKNSENAVHKAHSSSSALSKKPI